MPPSRDIDPFESPLNFFASELRRHRLRMGWTQEQLGRKVNYSEDTISKVETGEARPAIKLARKCDELFGTHGAMERLAEMVHKTSVFPSWFLKWPKEVEPKARKLRSWQPLLVDGLLQTEEYARAILRRRPGVTEDRVEEQVAARLERQQVLDREDPPLLWVVLDEWVLHRLVGSAKVMCEQLQALIDAVQRPHITIQIVPADAQVTGFTGAFAIASARDGQDTVYLESAREGHVTDEPEDVQAITDMWEAIRAKALPDDASLDLVSKVTEQWT